MKPYLVDSSLPKSIEKEYTVSELSQKIKNAIELTFNYIRVKGEISGLKIAGSGHCYFNIKDSGAVIACTCWRGNLSKMNIKLEDGLEVIISGNVTAYPLQSKYQINVVQIQHSGIGALMQILSKRKEKLAKEGYFDPSRKKSLPFLPKSIAVVTALGGAVIRDIVHRIKERCPINLKIWPVTVQGEKASDEITAAIEDINNTNLKPDIIILARGGGSIEDLWPFNEEIVVKAVADSSIPVISAVGHETDFTLVDFASDKRAPTPTAAAEFAVPVANDAISTINHYYKKIKISSINFVKYHKDMLVAHNKLLMSIPNISVKYQQQLDDIELNLRNIMPRIVDLLKNKLYRYEFRPSNTLKILKMKNIQLINIMDNLTNKVNTRINYKNMILYKNTNFLEILDYNKILDRGFTVVRDQNQNLITSHKVINESQEINIEFKDGYLKAITNSKINK